jgi:hypothetical protein
MTTLKDQIKSESQNKQVLKWLQDGQTITQFQAASYFSIYRLSARIYDLRKQGHNIQGKLQFEGSKHWSKYSLLISKN